MWGRGSERLEEKRLRAYSTTKLRKADSGTSRMSVPAEPFAETFNSPIHTPSMRTLGIHQLSSRRTIIDNCAGLSDEDWPRD